VKKEKAKDLEGEKVEMTDDQLSEDGVKSAKALVQAFLQTVKGYRLYDSSHPILLKFMERLTKEFARYFEELPSFSLQIGEHRLFYHGNVVYESDDAKESLAFVFFRDGIRELRFHRGLEVEELLDFLNVVRRSDAVNRMEDDLVTLLWEKDFPHITFTTIDEFLEKGSIFVPATEQDLLECMEFKPTEAAGPPESEQEDQAQGFGVLTDENLKRALNPLPGQSLLDACQLTPDELKRINREIQKEYQSEHLVIMIDSLIEILLHLGEDMDAYENMISFFDRLNQTLLDQKEIGKAAWMLQRFKETLESIALKDKQIFAIRRILEGATNTESVKLLGKTIHSAEGVPTETIVHYLEFLTPKAVAPLCTLLGNLDAPKWRKVIGSQVANLAREDIQPLVKFLSDPNPQLVCQVVNILGNIEHRSTLKHLGKLITHPEPKVREETLQALAKFGGKAQELIQKLLKDAVPEIRGKASLILARTIKDEAVRPLSEIILSDDFYRRAYDEKVSFFKALGETGSKEAVPILEKIAKKRNWFKKSKWEEMRLCATNALRMIETEKWQGAPVRPSAIVQKQ
jgi:hypothetical protein